MRFPRSMWLLLAIVSIVLEGQPCFGDAPYQRTRRSQDSGGVYKARIAPHWFEDNTGFWYRNTLPGGAREYVRVDAVNGVRERAFDHARIARALREAGVADARADRLPIEQLEFKLAENAVEFGAGEHDWRCDLATYELKKLDERETARESGQGVLQAEDAPRASRRTGPETELTFANRTSGEVELFWRDSEGRRRSYGKLPAGAERDQHTYAGHVWEIVDREGQTLAVFQATAEPGRAEISGDPAQRPLSRRAAGRRPQPRDASPNGKWTAFVRDHNVFVRLQEDGTEHQLSRDGHSDNSYGMLQWAPDSSRLVAFRIEPGDEKEVHLIESSPRDGDRARLHTRRYALPGDKYPAYELNLFDVDERKQIKPDVERIDFGRPRLRWNSDGHRFTYEKTDRGHQRFRVIEIDAQTGDARNIIDETSDTFIWTAHGPEIPITTYLDETDEIIYASERDGWRHLSLVDAAEGTVKTQITKGEWVVRGIDHVDEENRQIWFRASGRNPDQDPYLVHYYRVNFDGTGLVALTEGDGHHTIQFSPGRQYIIDTYSRVDMAPVHELRRVSDGKLVCELEQADISELQARGWEPPEVFVAEGRDGRTDIWGIICRPRDFDPEKKYAVIEHIYAGPHGSFVPKTFSPSRRFSSLTDLGFVVVQIDGMGTANRSKAFHDVCWKNLKDAGLPDRILWHQAVAEKSPWYDIERVGIYGVSAGGQNATAAVLFHPEFYKVAVSACGCHDNRMDKASWNEQWMGYPVGPHYAECSNIENAHRLEGKLLLIVGEMDTNVPPESTLRLADALIQADKNFDLLVVPGAGHGIGGRYGQRRMRDFFVRHLQGVEPPNRNTPQRSPVAGVSHSVLTESPSLASHSTKSSPSEDQTDPTDRANVPPLDLEDLSAASELRGVIERYTVDRDTMRRSQPAAASAREARWNEFHRGWLDRLTNLDFDALGHDAQVDYLLLRNHLEHELRQIELRSRADAEIAPLVPFAETIRNLEDSRRRLEPTDWSKTAGKLTMFTRQIAETRRALEAEPQNKSFKKTVANRAASRVDHLRRMLRDWHGFYDGYDPVFTWWMAEPYKEADQALEKYAGFLRQRFVGTGAASTRRPGHATGGADIVGDPIGREALLSELAYEMIPYEPDELIAIAEQEFAWCEREMKIAARELGFDDWRAALEHVKNQHVEPGKQPELIRQLALEAIDYVEEHDLVTVPPLCRDSWRMRMMSPERQLVNPFFTGGETISVSYPTNTMPHEAKLMSMRGNNLHFARATVHHELIPGHHLQGYMTARYRPDRSLFSTPFWTEGWALYWEMLLYERGDFAQSPEDRIGMLFWRMHRCARIIFSLGFHLEQMTPQECIDLLVERVGHERDNAIAEVRRSFESSYEPLYQAAYMLGGLQFRALYRELVESGRMSAREFHDAILRENRIPVELIRAILTKQSLARDFQPSWRFHGPNAGPSGEEGENESR